MPTSFTARKRIRKTFGRIPEVTTMPNLIEVQRESYEHFLQMRPRPADRGLHGLQEAFKSVFPIKDFADRAALDFVQYELEEPKYDVDECQQRDLTYAAALRVTLRLIVWDIDEETGSRSVRDIKEQDVYMGDLPLMTANGTFVVNGTERVIVSQMHRSPGVFFDHDRGKTHSSGKFLFAARIIPYRGSWLDFEFDAKDLVNVRIDRRRKLPASTFLMALGMTAEEILNTFYAQQHFHRAGGGWRSKLDLDKLKGQKLLRDLVDAHSGDVVLEAGTKVTPRQLKKLAESGVEEVFVSDDDLLGMFLAEDIIDESTGLVVAEAGDELSEDLLKKLADHGQEQLAVLDIDGVSVGPYIRNTLAVDRCQTREDALMDIYRVLRPGEPPTVETAEALFNGLFFDQERYDLSPVGRVKMNMRLDLQSDDTVRVLRREDIIAVVRTLLEIKDGRGEVDDIDHLGNRRVRSVGELMENQFRVGLLRMERAVRERMSSV
ncbi:MAG: DNA-directed RNA polymerase subunit beta, partial [Geminicoccaceae bacterium]